MSIEAAACPQDPHPALRLLCRMDADATLGLLRRALRDWDAVEADLADIVPSVAQQLPPTAGNRTMTQVRCTCLFIVARAALGGKGRRWERCRWEGLRAAVPLVMR